MTCLQAIGEFLRSKTDEFHFTSNGSGRYDVFNLQTCSDDDRKEHFRYRSKEQFHVARYGSHETIKWDNSNNIWKAIINCEVQAIRSMRYYMTQFKTRNNMGIEIHKISFSNKETYRFQDVFLLPRLTKIFYKSNYSEGQEVFYKDPEWQTILCYSALDSFKALPSTIYFLESKQITQRDYETRYALIHKIYLLLNLIVDLVNILQHY